MEFQLRQTVAPALSPCDWVRRSEQVVRSSWAPVAKAGGRGGHGGPTSPVPSGGAAALLEVCSRGGAQGSAGGPCHTLRPWLPDLWSECNLHGPRERDTFRKETEAAAQCGREGPKAASAP